MTSRKDAVITGLVFFALAAAIAATLLIMGAEADRQDRMYACKIAKGTWSIDSAGDITCFRNGEQLDINKLIREQARKGN